ncbi:hypothetical protein [Herbaspirillum camelliae]|uniref:hypothetical protein n=1 Tax=Herbaspirillum camelliae TaxID=1892903 RepID=UPI001179F2F9|nr:hypothetical protein [Herbaspirillum camelliae]
MSEPAFSADDGTLPLEPIRISSESKWTGAYIGFMGGFSQAKTIDQIKPDGDPNVKLYNDTGPRGIFDTQTSKPTLGTFVGYNFRRNGLVVGLEADVISGLTSVGNSGGATLPKLYV